MLRFSEIVQNGVSYLRQYYVGPQWRWFRCFVNRIGMVDNDRDPHDHPFRFITIPLRGYWEAVFEPGTGRFLKTRYVRPFVPHWRGWGFTHQIIRLSKTPVWTLCFAFGKRDWWGFWSAVGSYTPHEQYKKAGEKRYG